MRKRRDAVHAYADPVPPEEIGQRERLHATFKMGARATLLSALGDLVFPSEEPFATSVMLAVMREAGHETHAARQALSRVARSGWLSGERRGRETWWTITEAGRELIRDGHRGVDSLAEPVSLWGGQWLVLLITVPHDRRAVRTRLFRYLTWSSFGTPAPAVWVSPFPEREHSARSAIEHFGLRNGALSFVGRSASIGMDDREIVQRAWPLENLEQRYSELLDDYSARRATDGRQAVRCLLDLDVDLQRLRMLDPQLPEALAPQGRRLAQARRLMAFKDRWRDQARSYVAELG